MELIQEEIKAVMIKQVLEAKIVNEVQIDLDGTAKASEILIGKTAYVETVKTKVTGTMPIYDGAVEIEPSTVEQTLETENKFNANNIVAKPVTSAIDGNIVSENIKKDITILGVTGKNTVVDTEENISPMNASDVLKDKVGFVNGSKITGTLDLSDPIPEIKEIELPEELKDKSLVEFIVEATGDILLSGTNVGLWLFDRSVKQFAQLLQPLGGATTLASFSNFFEIEDQVLFRGYDGIGRFDINEKTVSIYATNDYYRFSGHWVPTARKVVVIISGVSTPSRLIFHLDNKEYYNATGTSVAMVGSDFVVLSNNDVLVLSDSFQRLFQYDLDNYIQITGFVGRPYNKVRIKDRILFSPSQSVTINGVSVYNETTGIAEILYNQGARFEFSLVTKDESLCFLSSIESTTTSRGLLKYDYALNNISVIIDGASHFNWAYQIKNKCFFGTTNSSSSFISSRGLRYYDLLTNELTVQSTSFIMNIMPPLELDSNNYLFNTGSARLHYETEITVFTSVSISASAETSVVVPIGALFYSYNSGVTQKYNKTTKVVTNLFSEIGYYFAWNKQTENYVFLGKRTEDMSTLSLAQSFLPVYDKQNDVFIKLLENIPATQYKVEEGDFVYVSSSYDRLESGKGLYKVNTNNLEVEKIYDNGGGYIRKHNDIFLSSAKNIASVIDAEQDEIYRAGGPELLYENSKFWCFNKSVFSKVTKKAKELLSYYIVGEIKGFENFAVCIKNNTILLIEV
jgi:hypothetical protein